jgi:UDP-N-acetyl-2-amino-2-deoxyglucuronate dehydrogenase
VNVGLVGGGNISGTHARAAVAAGLRIAGVYGGNPDKARELAERHGAPAFQTIAALLAHAPLDCVMIGSPSGLHASHAIAAVQAGKHVLVEKPLDIATPRIDRLIDEVDRAGVTLGVFFQDRLKPAIADIKRRIDAGEIGTPLLATGEVKWFRPREYYSSSRWRGTWALDGGGALMNQGIHTVDVLLYLLGPVVRVSGLIATRYHAIETEDTASALLEFANGAQGTIDATTAASPGLPRRVRITGSAGSLVLEEDAASAVVSDVSNHQRIIEDFVAAIQEGRRPICDAREGRRSVAVVEAIYQSAREQRLIEVSEARNR